MERIKPKQRVVWVDGERFNRAFETSESIYFVNPIEGDESANTLMYDINSLELISNNAFANGSLFEDIEEGKAKNIKKDFQYNYDEILKEKLGNSE